MQMLVKAQQELPQFIISTGDNIYPNGVDSVDDKQWQTKFKNVYTGDALKLPWYAVLGNQDYRLSPEAQVEYSRHDAQWNMPELCRYPVRTYHVMPYNDFPPRFAF